MHLVPKGLLLERSAFTVLKIALKLFFFPVGQEPWRLRSLGRL